MPKKTLEYKDYPLCSADHELRQLIKARQALIYVVTWEEQRVIDNIIKICDSKGVDLSGVHVWDAALGMTDEIGEPVADASQLKTAEDVLDYIMRKAEEQQGVHSGEKATRGPVYVLCDFFRFLERQELEPYLERKLRVLPHLLRDTTIHVVITSPVLELPVSLEKIVNVVDYPLPERSQLTVQVESSRNFLVKNRMVPAKSLKSPTTEKVVDALLGLTHKQAEDALAIAIVKKQRFDIDILNGIKQQIIRKGQLLEYICSDENMDTVGGFEGLKEFIQLRKAAFSKEARDYGLRAPRGVFMLGMHGSGKSLSAKAVANEFHVPLLKLDMGSMFSQWVGESEGNIRRALSLAESVAPCVLLVDEVDKGLAGASGRNQADSTAKRVVGHLVDWMQTKTAPVFIVACANSIKGIPPAILRKGRFDELFFVDLPSPKERDEIFRIHITKRGRDPAKFDVEKLSKRTEGFSGAEIEGVVEEAMYMAFADGGREFGTDDMLLSIQNSKPLSNLESVKEVFDELREEAAGRMRFVNEPLYKNIKKTGHNDGGRFANMDVEER